MAVVVGGWSLFGAAVGAEPASGDGQALRHEGSPGVGTPPGRSWVSDVAVDAIANGRKYLDRLEVASGTREWTKSPSVGLLSKAQQTYLVGDFTSALTTASDAAKQLSAALQQVIQDNVRREQNTRQGHIDQARDATRAFDFAQGMYLFNDGGSYLGEFHHLERWGEFEDPLGFHVEPIKRG